MPPRRGQVYRRAHSRAPVARIPGAEFMADSMGAGDAARQRLLKSLASALCGGALPGELKDFGAEECNAAAVFIAACAGRRTPGTALVKLEPTGTKLGHRRMRIGIVNDDMPFLVDSVANTLAARNLTVHRLLHPVVSVRRDAQGCLEAVEPLGDTAEA